MTTGRSQGTRNDVANACRPLPWPALMSAHCVVADLAADLVSLACRSCRRVPTMHAKERASWNNSRGDGKLPVVVQESVAPAFQSGFLPPIAIAHQPICHAERHNDCGECDKVRVSRCATGLM